MHKHLQISQESLFLGKGLKSKQNDSKYMNAIKPYVAKQRKISKRDSKTIIPTSQFDHSKSKSRKHDHSSRKFIEENTCNSKNMSDVLSELKALKSEYRLLKESYNNMKKEKDQITNRGNEKEEEMERNIQYQEKQANRYKQNVVFLQSQMERMRKQCLRLLETEKFKNKKLEETIQQKQLMIAYLRSQLALANGESPRNTNGLFVFQNTAPTYHNNNQTNQNQTNTGNIFKNNIQINLPRQAPIKKHNHTSIVLDDNSLSKPNSVLVNKHSSIIRQSPQVSEIKERREYIFSSSDQSVSFSRQKEGSLDSDVEEPTVLTFTKKDVIIFDEESKNQIMLGNQSRHQDIGEQSEYHKDTQEFNQDLDESSLEEINYPQHAMGCEELPTFENRSSQAVPPYSQINRHLPQKQSNSQKYTANKRNKKPTHKPMINKSHKSNQGLPTRHIKPKSKQNTKRLMIYTDDEEIIENLHGEKSNGNSLENGKKLKTKKKNISSNQTSRKRKSQENCYLHHKR